MHRITGRRATIGALGTATMVALLAGCGGNGPTASNASAGSSTNGVTVSATRPPVGAREQAYLAALRRAGITPGDTDSEISVARYICQAVKQGAPGDQLATMVDAVAGSDAKSAGKNVSESELTSLGAAYINAAKSTYCR